MKNLIGIVGSIIVLSVGVQAADISYSGTVTDAQTIGAGDRLLQRDGNTATITTGGSVTITSTSTAGSLLGQLSTGALIIDGGDLSVSASANFIIGNGTGGNGSLDLRAGTLTLAPTGDLIIGRDAGTGVLTIRGGVAVLNQQPVFDTHEPADPGFGSIDFADQIGGGASDGTLTISGANAAYYESLYTGDDLTYNGDNSIYSFYEVFSVSNETLSVLPAVGAGSGNEDPTRPNVIMIYYDDMGYSDMGAYDTTQTSLTPRLDTFASEGMRFTAGHSADAVCTPSRYALMTGRYCWRTSLKTSVNGGYTPSLIEDDRFTFAEMFRSFGYKTAMVGKWHIGMQFYDPSGNPIGDLANNSNVLDGDNTTTTGDSIDFSHAVSSTPYHNGFDYYFGTPASLDMPPYVWLENETVLFKGGFVTNGVVDFSQARPATNADLLEGEPIDAVNNVRDGVYDPNFIVSDYLQVQAAKVADLIEARANDGAPFFIYVPMPAPHRPWAVDADFAGSTPYSYGDYLAQTDHYTGLILDALADPDGNPLTDDSMVSNTVVFISSDNGPEKIAQTANLAAGYDGNGSFRGLKRDNWEGGTRVPFLVRWPGVVEPGTTDHACWQGDFFASMAEFLRYDFSSDEAPDAESFLPILLGEEMPEFRREGFVQHSMEGQLAIVDKNGEWKLLDGTGSGGYTETYDADNMLISGVGGTVFGTPRQLFNLLNDPGERTNLLTVASPTQDALDKEAELYALLNEFRGNTSYGTDGDSNVPPFDSDRDGMANSYEKLYDALDLDDPTDAGVDLEPDGLTNLEEYEAGTSPVDPDSDGDRLGDYQEVRTYGTLPMDPHSDADSLPDGDEVLIWGTDPLSADTDSDGAGDDYELSVFTNPNNPESVPGSGSGGLVEIELSPSVVQLAGYNGTANDPAVEGDASSGWAEAGSTFVRSRATGGSNPQWKTQLFLHFDLSEIPEGFSSARLRIYQNNRLNTQYSADLQVARVTEGWDSSVGNYPVYDSTGVADALVFGNNSDFGTAIDASGFFSGTVGVPGTDEGFDVTSLVEGWFNGTITNCGLRVAFDEEDYAGAAFSESDDPATTNQNEALQLILSVNSASRTDVDSDEDDLLDSYEMDTFGNLDQSGGDDSDNDGVINFVEQSLGSDPTTNASLPVIQLVTTNAADVALSYHRYNQAGLGVEVLVSENMTEWTDFTRFYQIADPAPASELGDGYDKVMLEPVSTLPGQLFYKIQIHTYTNE
ncbi:sulfatase-like hydrolase/transferase [Pontiellaceae bacterium B1224]|nr:sulfatase-like hydrolase/transferase [Pontiellaceae bacterium B1224]